MPLDNYFTDRVAAGDQAPPPVSPPAPADVTVRDTAVPGPHGDVPLRTYRPDGPVATALLWVHGGGFWHGDLDMPEADWVSAELARRARAYVVSVGYRLANGEVRHPVPIDDVYAAWSWLAADEALPERRALGGASAGAALALATALRARDTGLRPPDALLLAYPFAHFPNPQPDLALATELAEVLPPELRFPPSGIEDMVRNYVGRISDLPPDALPGAARLDGLPPSFLVLSEYDDLRSSGELLARQLDEAGVKATTYLALQVPHGHLNHPVDVPGITGSLEFFVDALDALDGR